MAATYDPTDLDKTTDAGRLNVVRFLLGDTEVTSAELQDEEIVFALAEATNKTYLAASVCASAIASKYAGYTDVEIDGILTVDYGELSNSYGILSIRLKTEGNRLEGSSIGIFIGGLPVFPTKSYTFYRGQFEDPNRGEGLDEY